MSARKGPEQPIIIWAHIWKAWVYNPVLRVMEAIGLARGFATPSPYRKSDAHPDGWEPDQLVTWQGMEDYVELLIPEIRQTQAQNAEIIDTLQKILLKLN